MYYVIRTFGCKVNQYESDAIKTAMNAAHFEYNEELPDIAIINSCTVTETSDNKVNRYIKTLREKHPSIIIVLTGCYAQSSPERARKLGVEILLGVNERGKTPEFISSYIKDRHRLENIIPHPKLFEELENTDDDKTRAFIKIEDGCDNFCSYCIIPFARGGVRSRPPESIKKAAMLAAKSGKREIVLAGINLSRYGSDFSPEMSLADAVEFAASVENIRRIRLGSVEPELLTEKIARRMKATNKLCPHFHLSLQSGAKKTLADMNRHYTPEEYESTVKMLRNVFPDAVFTTDVMVGFPTESDDDFNESMLFLQKIGFTKVHVFTYSPRSGTVAAKLPQISDEIKSLRYKKMKTLANRLEQDYLNTLIGKEREILIEKQTDPSYINGHSPDYINIRVYSENTDKYPRHSFLNVKITEIKENYAVAIEQ